MTTVTQAQSYWRKYKEVQQSHVNLLRLQWNLVEDELIEIKRVKMEREQKKEDILKNALNYTSTGAKKRKPLLQHSSSKRESILPEILASEAKKIVIKVPESIKNRILLANLRKRHSDYAVSISFYKREIERYETELRERLAIEKARKEIAESLEPKNVPEAPPSRPGTRNSSSRPSTSHLLMRTSGSRPASRGLLNTSQPLRPQTRNASAKRRIPKKDEPPTYPGPFRILLSKQEMVELVEKGFRKAESEENVLANNLEESNSDNESDDEDVSLDVLSSLIQNPQVQSPEDE